MTAPVSLVARWWRPFLLLVAAGWLFAGSIRPAQAQRCYAASTTMAFGTITTGDNVAYTGSTTIDVNCTGNANQDVDICPYIGGGPNAQPNGPRSMLSGSASLYYDLYTRSSLSTRYSNGTGGDDNRGRVLSLNSNGSGSISITVYGQIPAGQQAAAAGSYSASMSTSSQITYAYDTGDNRYSVDCSTVSSSRSDGFTFTSTATNQASCSLSTTPVQFGTAQLLTANRDGTGAITVSCSTGSAFSLALNGGANGGTSATTRRMANGTNRITYGLYQNSARSTGWYNDTAGVVKGTGTGNSQSFTVYGRVPPQTTPRPGTYTDTVVVTLSY